VRQDTTAQHRDPLATTGLSRLVDGYNLGVSEPASLAPSDAQRERPGRAERLAAAFAHASPLLNAPLLVPGVLLLVGGHTTPFLRRHARSALLFQLTVLGLITPIVWLYWLTLSLYTLVVLLAVVGGACLVVVATVRALRGRDRPYVVDWLESAAPPAPVPQSRRTRRAWWALLAAMVLYGVRWHPAVVHMLKYWPGYLFNWVIDRTGVS
jgi:Domain of unknown function (DUF4870)